ncbi:MAG: SH3 domain-containing protein [Ardenticatenaceae bacterium]|nr:SH3 domain-containing protein [Ardenticatenaceae bacterium]MCB8973001.1 SH3 domain-containing protein [Ardenticatenaceae bacterium]
MARYQIPPDPRDPKNDPPEKRPRRLRQDSQEPIPWRWLGLGLVVTVISIALSLMLVNSLLTRPPLEAAPIEPTLIILTAPPSPVPSPTSPLPTPSPIPTFTPIPTPDTAVAPPEITVGFYALVANTDGFGINLRGGPSTSNAQITVVNEGTLVLVIGGPELDEANDRLWWQLQLEDGTEGWSVGEFLLPAAGP